MQKRHALFLDVVVEQIAKTSRLSDSKGEVLKQIELLATLVPDWCTIQQISRGRLLKLNPSIDFKVVTKRLAAAQ